MTYILNKKHICRMEYYMSNLGAMLLLICQHIKYKCCYFHTKDNECVLAFPNFFIHAEINDEISLNIEPAIHSLLHIVFNKNTDTLSSTSKHKCFHIINPALVKLEKVRLTQNDVSTVMVKQLIPTAYLPPQSTPGATGFSIQKYTVSNYNR